MSRLGVLELAQHCLQGEFTKEGRGRRRRR